MANGKTPATVLKPRSIRRRDLTSSTEPFGMGLFGSTKDWNVIAILFEKKGHFQVNGNRAKGPQAEKVRDFARRHARSVFWAVFDQKRAFVEGGEGAGKDFVTLEVFQYIERNLAKTKGVQQVLALLEKGKTDKAATGWEITAPTRAPDDE
jgi:hypothetical protein